MTTNDERMKLLTALQPKFQEAMGPWQDGDWYCFEEDSGKYSSPEVFWHTNLHFVDDAIRLPLPIDPRNPERGLWGIVDWTQVECFTGYSGEITISRRGSCEHIAHQLTPELALLRALCHQEGIEVKGSV